MNNFDIKPKFYRLTQIVGDPKKRALGLLPISRATWLRGVEKRIFPPPVKLGPRMVAWKADDIHRLIEEFNSGNFN